jgi:hypothetical protein
MAVSDPPKCTEPETAAKFWQFMAGEIEVPVYQERTRLYMHVAECPVCKPKAQALDGNTEEICRLALSAPAGCIWTYFGAKLRQFVSRKITVSDVKERKRLHQHMLDCSACMKEFSPILGDYAPKPASSKN